MDEPEQDHGDRAVRLLGTERWPAVADAYTMGAYGLLAGYEGFGRDMTAERSSVGDGLRQLFLAGTAARLAGDDARARNRALQGVLVATDHRRRVDGVDAAACLEWTGHLRTLAEHDDKASDAYDRAAAAYESTAPDDPATATTRPLL
jgi:hypothetical protein